MLNEVSLLFADHSDLLEGFTFYLPEYVRSQARALLAELAREKVRARRVARRCVVE